MNENAGTYLYCFALPGMIEGLQGIGVDGLSSIETIAVGRTAAVCSRVSLDEFRADTDDDQGPNLDWIVPRAYRHEKVIEQVMCCSPVLPVRFGAVFSSPWAVKAFLVRQEPRIARFLSHTANREEWAVKGYVDAKRAEAWLLDNDQALMESRHTMSTSPGKRYLQERQIRAGIQQQIKRWGRSAAAEVVQRLQQWAAESQPLKMQSPQLSGKTDEMVLNVAFLLPKDGIAAFRGEVERVAAEFETRGLSLACTGPWPPFSFCPDLEETVA